MKSVTSSPKTCSSSIQSLTSSVVLRSTLLLVRKLRGRLLADDRFLNDESVVPFNILWNAKFENNHSLYLSTLESVCNTELLKSFGLTV